MYQELLDSLKENLPDSRIVNCFASQNIKMIFSIRRDVLGAVFCTFQEEAIIDWWTKCPGFSVLVRDLMPIKLVDGPDVCIVRGAFFDNQNKKYQFFRSDEIKSKIQTKVPEYMEIYYNWNFFRV